MFDTSEDIIEYCVKYSDSDGNLCEFTAQLPQSQASPEAAVFRAEERALPEFDEFLDVEEVGVISL